MGWQPFEFQRETWEALGNGKSGIVHAPTGTGKTMAVWGGVVNQYAESTPPPLSQLWITPLRALAADTANNLNRPLQHLNAPWQVHMRTGDTSSSERARQRRNPPSGLVTTPESLSLLLSYADASRVLGRVETIVVDEWHELIGNKRGVLLQLSLARVASLNPDVKIWGVSATLGNLSEARDVLLGPGSDAKMIRGHIPKEIVIESLIPDNVERFPWAGHLGLRQIPEVIKRIEEKRSTLLFTNTRSQAELWFNGLSSCAPGWTDRIALHHGSIDQATRRDAEQRLASGELKCVVATSSLDLGIDFSPVDQVIQVGSPKGIARLIQRAGRSGHQPGEISRILCVPTHGLELVEIAAARRAALAGNVEPRAPLKLSLDVLAQHCITVAVGGGFVADEMLAEVRSTHSFAELTDEMWRWVLKFITTGGDTLSGYPAFHKVVIEDDRYKVTSRRVASRHRMAVGTITADASVSVQWVKGGRLGAVEESFIAKLKPKDRFLFSGRVLELIRVRDLVAQVRRAKGRPNRVPRWQGGRLPLSSELSAAVLAVLDDYVAAQASGTALADDVAPEMNAMGAVMATQQRWSRIPVPDILLVEHTTSREGHHLVVYPFAGRLTHEGIATLLAWRLSQLQPVTYSISVNDYGFELAAAKASAPTAEQLADLLSTDNLLEDVISALNATEMARRKFRDIARIAGLVFQGFPGAGKSHKQIQASSGLIFDVLAQFDPDNPLLDQARREVLESELEYRRLESSLELIRSQEIVVIETPRLTPFAFPLWAERLRHTLTSENWKARIQRAAEQLEKAASRRR